MNTYAQIIIFFMLFSGCQKQKDDSGGNGNKQAENSLNCYQIVGVDQFGRSFTTVTSLKKDKQVGLFFWPWIGQPYASGIWDATKILGLPNGVKILTDFNSLDESISPNGQAHYWGEPLWGYYNSDDEWVIRKQMQMLTIAGIDFIYFDTTNALIYKNVFMKVLGVIDEYLKSGWNPPKVVFYTHSHSLQTTRDLYRELYSANLYPDTWYRVNGKPMIIADTDPEDDLAEARSRADNNYTTGPLSAEILNFFHFVRPQWPSDPVYPDGFPWVEWTFPQPLHGKIINVTVASHPAIPMSFSVSRENQNWGRGWNPNTKANVESDVDKGTFFQEQWDHALSVDPAMITIGGWNEWIAYKQPYDGEYMLCDAVNKEFSRDIEPMNGGYQDAFYIQMIRNIRRYKGMNDTPEPAERATIDIEGDLSQWDRVKYCHKNIDDTYPERDSYGGAMTVRYTQAAPADKLQEVKVTHDNENLYFLVKCKAKITSDKGKGNWINLFIGTGEPELKGWESYDYLIGTKYENDETDICRLNNDFSANVIGSAMYDLKSSILQIRIPRATIGLNNAVDKFYFKLAAGVENPSDIMNYYQTGSV
ncbi:MAG: hypothetical protein ABFD10_18190, partial [Prolixibacteraceae bacterium]